jgi:hypothetical protein
MLSEIALINPRRRRKHRKVRARRRRHVARRHRARRRRSTVIVARRINPRRRHRVHHRRYRHRARNPRFSIGGVTRALLPAAIGGAGAVGLDIALGYASGFLPPALTTGYGKVVVQIAGAFGLGMVAGKVMGREKGHAVTLGALTVALYSLIKTTVRQAAPTLPGLSGIDGLGYMGAYMPPSLGYTNAAPALQGFGAYMQAPVGSAMGGFDGMSDGM